LTFYAVPLWDVPAVPVTGSSALFPVRHVYCVTRNYDPAAAEPGGLAARQVPAIFTKAPGSVLALGGDLPYPPETDCFEPEIELVIAIGEGGGAIAPETAERHIFGYTLGLDMTRRDLQRNARAEGRPWDIAKWFDAATPLGAIRPVGEIGHPGSGAITLDVNDARIQQGDLNQMIWKPNEVVALVARYQTLAPGDIIFTGTPEGETVVGKGDRLVGEIEGIGRLSVTIT
jgi:fumarylpyruvate hydrolase